MVPSPVRAVARGLLLHSSDAMAVALRRPARFVFILGHMRSGSTLLSHLLTSHRDILGYGELLHTYRDAASFDEARMGILRYHRALMRPPRYFVDQINHGHLTPDAGLLDDPRIRLIFLLRRPLPALGSLAKLAGPRQELLTTYGPDYYCERLGQLARLAGGLSDPTRAISLSYEALLLDPPTQLARLDRFLRLRQPLREEYELFGFTGRRGDPGPLIHSGRIVRDKQDHPIDLSDQVSAAVERAYSDCWDVLRSACRG